MSRESLLAAAGRRTLVCDCGMGTELQRAGLEPGTCGELWSIERPDVVYAIQRANLAAGADIILTNTFNGSRIALGRHELARHAPEINHAAAALARAAAGSDHWVLGDMGPFGGFLEPLGEATAADVTAAFREQAEALLAGGADGIIVETMSAPDELALAVVAARQAGASFVLASATFELTTAGLRTMMGSTPEDIATAALAAGADALGANCGTRLGMEDYLTIVRRYRAIAPNVMVAAQPNAGTPRLEGAVVRYDGTPAQFAAAAPGLVAAGASIIGGCCGTTPTHIEALARALRG